MRVESNGTIVTNEHFPVFIDVLPSEKKGLLELANHPKSNKIEFLPIYKKDVGRKLDMKV